MPAADFTFSGAVREIIINPGVTNVNVQDMYSRWKQWVRDSDNSKYFQAFTTFGGDPTIPGQFAPRYFFLTNNWQVRVNNNEDVDFETNLYTDNVGTSPFIVGSGSSVSNRNSDAVIVDDPIAEALDYGGIVNVNPKIGVSGTTYPIGTLAQPVNNIIDAKAIAQSRGIFSYHIFGEIPIDIEIHDSIIFGGNVTDVCDIQDVNVSGTTFNQVHLRGHYFGKINATKCVLDTGLEGMEGIFGNCGIAGDLSFDDGVKTEIDNCVSHVPGFNSPRFFIGNDVSLSVRKWSGGIKWYDIKSGSSITAEYMAGNCQLLTGCTGGEIHVRGITKFNNKSSGTTVITEGLMIPINIQQGINTNTELLKNK